MRQKRRLAVLEHLHVILAQRNEFKAIGKDGKQQFETMKSGLLTASSELRLKLFFGVIIARPASVHRPQFTRSHFNAASALVSFSRFTNMSLHLTLRHFPSAVSFFNLLYRHL